MQEGIIKVNSKEITETKLLELDNSNSGVFHIFHLNECILYCGTVQFHSHQEIRSMTREEKHKRDENRNLAH